MPHSRCVQVQPCISNFTWVLIPEPTGTCFRELRVFLPLRGRRARIRSPRGQKTTVHLQRAPTGHRMVKVPRPNKLSAVVPSASFTAHPVSVPLDVSSQCNRSPPPRSHTDTCSTASWSRHLIQQTLMDEGLRLARMVSHDRAGLCMMSLASEGIHSTGDFPSSEMMQCLK